MKTLKQIADEIGVPKQQVYRYVKAECINEVHHNADEVHQSKSVKYYDEAAESAIKEYFKDKAKPVEVHHDTVELHHEAHQNRDEAHHDAVQNDSLKRENERLTALLDQHRADHKGEVQRLTSIIDGLQASHAAEIDRMQAQISSLQDQLDAERQHSREQAEKLAQLADQAQRLQLMQMQPPAQIEQKPPNFWQRLFGKKTRGHDFDIDGDQSDSPN